MRRLTCLFLTLLLLLSLTACGGSVPTAQDVPAPSESEDPSATPSENVEVPAEEPAEEPAAEEETVEAPAEAPETFDFGVIAAVAAIVSAAGYALSRKSR